MALNNAVFLFETTGYMAEPFARRGWHCYCFDLLNDDRKETFPSGGSITYIRADLFDPCWRALILSFRPRFLAAFPPCTDLAISGRAFFAKKLEDDPEYLAKAMALVYLAADLGEEADCPYFIENPVSVISTEWRKPDFSFSPHEYGGYLPENDQHPDYPMFIPPQDAYTKKTCLWAGGGFTLPAKRPVMPWPGLCPQMNNLGGKSERTKRIRSATPRGFAEATARHVIELECFPEELCQI